MTLVYSGTSNPWRGERIEGVLYPINIEQLWPDAELSAIGLERYTPPPAPPAPLACAHVDAERDRRIAAGHDVTIGDGRTISVQTRDERDFRNLNGLVSQAIVFTVLQQPDAAMLFRDASDTNHQVTPAQMIEIGSLVAAKVQAIYQAAWTIKALDVVPLDYASAERWP